MRYRVCLLVALVLVALVACDGDGKSDFEGEWLITHTVIQKQCDWEIYPITIRIEELGNNMINIHYQCNVWSCTGSGTVDGNEISFYITTDSLYQGRLEADGTMSGTARYSDESCLVELSWEAVRVESS